MTVPMFHAIRWIASKLRTPRRRLPALPTRFFELGILPAKFAGPLQPPLPDERLLRARRAASLGVKRQPQQPGLWLRTTSEGTQRLYRVRDHNGRLYATVGGIAPVAVPTARMPGYWDLVA
jgi:hypothetical protein